MIVTRSPLRLTLLGGATDVPSYYEEFGPTQLVSVAINKYVYVACHRTFLSGIILKYSSLEHVEEISQIQHPIIRECMSLVGFRTPQIEITSYADIPAGSGMGSSSAFCCGLLKALYAHKHIFINQHDLAKKACEIEINKLANPIGKQDQYISSFGGLQVMDFLKDGTVSINPLQISHDKLYLLEDSILLFFTGFTRSANSMLADQQKKMQSKNEDMIANLKMVQEDEKLGKDFLINGNIKEYGELVHNHWLRKRNRSQGMTNERIDYLYDVGIKNGAIGGKLLGAGGGGGFLMFIADDPKSLRNAMAKEGIEELRFRFEYEGTKEII